MGLISVNEVLRHADGNAYAVGAFNVVNLEFLNGILEAAERKRSPIILQIAEVHFPYVDIEEITPAIQAMADRTSVPVVLGLDHGQSIETIVRAIRCGFSAVMFDGSKLPFEENIEQTALAVKIAHAVGVSVEAELGQVGGAEGAEGLAVAHEEFFTDPHQAAEFVQRTGVDALAVAIGNAHGLYKGIPKLDFQRLETIKKNVDVPLVLHGGSGIPDDDFRRATQLGISKINFFTEMSREATLKVRHMLEENPNLIGLQDLMMGAKEAISRTVEDRIEVFGSAGVCGTQNVLCSICGSCALGTGKDESRPAAALDQEVLVGVISEVVARALKNEEGLRKA
jgi:fructose-bisphosphate aldolase class II